MTAYDWGRFTLRININAGRQKIYDAWTRQDNLEKWFLSLAEFSLPEGGFRDKGSYIQQGDKYRWLWCGHAEDVVERGEVLDANGKDMLKFTFSGNSTVIVKIYTEDRENIVELTQVNIPTDETSKKSYHLNCYTGWTFYLTNLKSVLENGNDLRNKNAKLKKMANC